MAQVICNTGSKAYRVTGDFDRMTYSEHSTLAAAQREAKALTQKWGKSHPGSEPRVEQLTGSGWVLVQ
jgi:hypothetical protein